MGEKRSLNTTTITTITTGVLIPATTLSTAFIMIPGTVVGAGARQESVAAPP